MKFDTVIMGGGLAGLLCGLATPAVLDCAAPSSPATKRVAFFFRLADLLSTLPDGRGNRHTAGLDALCRRASNILIRA